MQAILHFYVV
jgi:hypothetical protein